MMLDIDNEEIYDVKNGQTVTAIEVADKEIIKEIVICRKLKSLFIDVNDDELKEALEMAADDIKFNRIGFNKKTSFKEMIDITNKCLIALRRS